MEALIETLDARSVVGLVGVARGLSLSPLSLSHTHTFLSHTHSHLSLTPLPLTHAHTHTQVEALIETLDARSVVGLAAVAPSSHGYFFFYYSQALS